MVNCWPPVLKGVNLSYHRYTTPNKQALHVSDSGLDVVHAEIQGNIQIKHMSIHFYQCLNI